MVMTHVLHVYRCNQVQKICKSVLIFTTCMTSDLQVREIASDPDEYNTFVTTFDDIQDIVLDIQGILCDRTLFFCINMNIGEVDVALIL